MITATSTLTTRPTLPAQPPERPPNDEAIVRDLNLLLNNPNPEEGQYAYEPYQRSCWGPFCRRKYITPEAASEKLAQEEEVRMDQQVWTHWDWEWVCHWIPDPPPGNGRDDCRWERRWQPWPHRESTGRTFTLHSPEDLREFYVAQDIHGLVQRYGLGR